MIRVGPRGAMLLALQTAVLTLLVERPENLLVLAGLAALYWIGGAGRARWRLMLLVLVAGTWSVAVSQGLFYAAEPRTALFQLLPPEVFPLGPGLYLYREGVIHGLVQSLRFSVVVLLGAGLLGRFSADQLTTGLRGLRVPESLCFLFSMAMRFLPMLLEEARAAWNAQHFRGYRVRRLLTPRQGLHGGVRALALPLLAAQVRKSDEVAAALIARGYSPGDSVPGPLPPVSGGERGLCWLGGFLVVALGAAMVLTRLHLAGAWSRDELNWLYNVVVSHV